MDKTLQLRLLGNSKISLADLSIAEALSAKAQAILIYLAVTNQPQPRSALASLLWQEAEIYWQESLAICREIGDQNGIGQGLNFLRHSAAGLALAQEIGNKLVRHPNASRPPPG